ncbi:WD40 repeat-like protein [Pseudovirgaria hyperparasitica]|uniref:WD40 repeat-like protein n=1 Tax=Pseudovirgaria hyperparasitica TaxID=470096 RepID=A0A6A6W6D4_9PEZI|nr:WD40 repeat-like protein [Pseudovirgaria hyperparasitica]KAF2757749.1 WD40 repeat-like protein [Pseudovirgaria hyperparasitica]
MSAHQPHDDVEDVDDDMLEEDEIGEEVPSDDDAAMDSDEDADEDPSATLEEIQLINDSVAHFDGHKDSIFCIASHPRNPNVVATGGGDDVGYILDATPPQPPVLPPSYESDPRPVEREGLKPIFKLEGHTDSINAITFTLPRGEYVVSAGLDGKLRTWQSDASGLKWRFIAEAQEVEEINWLAACPHPEYPNTVAMGANDGSVWVYTINAADKTSPLSIVQTFYIHQESCTAGAWTPDGKLLATVSEDSSLYVWDVFGEAAAAGLVEAQGSQSVVGLTGHDERFKVEGGLYSIAISPNGSLIAVGGPEGQIRIVGLPRLGADASATSSATGAGQKGKAAGGKQAGGPKAGSSGQAGQILASLQAGSDSVETISFAQPPLTLMAAGNVDGSIVLFDVAHRFAARRRIENAHEDEGEGQAVIKVEFSKKSGQGGWLLTSCGNDGVVRRWDARGGTTAAARGLVGEWRGHRGGGDGGGIMGFVQGKEEKSVVTAGDDHITLVFSTPVA